MRDQINAFIARHQIAWELGMGFLAIVYVAIGFALDDPTRPMSIAVVLESLLTVMATSRQSPRKAAWSPPR